jgi:hypothetical protein
MGHGMDPDLERARFRCPGCDGTATQEHYDLQGVRGPSTVRLPVAWAMTWCTACQAVTILHEGQQVIPPQLYGEFDATGLPGDITDEIRRARATLFSSPPASAAHARTALYAMLREAAARQGVPSSLPPDALFARLVPAEQTVTHACFRDTCLRDGIAVPAGVHIGQDPLGTAGALLEVLRLAKALFYQ